MVRKPRLLVLTPEYPPHGGGIGRFCAQIAEAAAGTAEVSVITGVPARGDTGTAAFPAGRFAAISRRPGAAGSMAFLAAASCAAVKEARRFRPDAVLCAHLELAPAGRLLRALRLARRTAAIVHGTELFSSALRRFRLGALRAQDLVIANSRYTREAAKELGVPEGRLRVLHPALPDGNRPPSGDPDRGRARLGLPPGAPVVLTVARMDPAQRHKGHDTVIAAWPAVLAAQPEARWVVAGGGADRGRLEGLARERGLADRVLFAGWVDDAVLADLYAASDVFLMASRELHLPGGKRVVEGFGIVYLEAAIHGLPVIAGRAGGAPDAVEDGTTGFLVDPEDPGAIAAAVARLLADPALAVRMGAAGRERVWREFDMRRNIAQLVGELFAGDR